MATLNVADYTFELWDNANIVADISKFCKNKKLSLRRNDAEEVSFDLDLRKFEALCSEIDYSANEALKPYSSEVKVKRNGQYLIGTQVVSIGWSLSEADAMLNVRCTGYLNLFKDRYITKTYTQQDATEIVRDMIATAQAEAYGNYGVTVGPNQTTTVFRDRTYSRQNIKEEIRRLTELETGRFDFEFTYDKKINTYEQIGSVRENMLLRYPGNITSISGNRDASTLFNKIIGLGSGIGAEALVSNQTDALSAQNYKLREKIVTFNNVITQSTVDENTFYELRQHREIIDIPKIVVSGVHFDLNVARIGDIIPVKIDTFSFLSNFDDLYRIERIDVTIDDNAKETITLTIDTIDY